MEYTPDPIYFYSDFIKKLIRAGRRDGTKTYFRFGHEIDRSDFIKFSHKFIETYYATLPPEFTVKHPMKFCFGKINEDDLIEINSKVGALEIEDFPTLDAGLLHIEITTAENPEHKVLDASIYRQACFIRRERLKLFLMILGSVVAIAALGAAIFIRK